MSEIVQEEEKKNTANWNVQIDLLSLQKSLQNLRSIYLAGLKCKSLPQGGQPGFKVWILPLSCKSSTSFVEVFSKRSTCTLQSMVLQITNKIVRYLNKYQDNLL